MGIANIVIVSATLLLSGVVIITLLKLIRYKNPDHEQLARAGIVLKTKKVNEVVFNYAEGPDKGPALVLFHAQLLDWFSYHRVLAKLSRKFHVFAVDYPGHGQTRLPSDYAMTANQIGSDLAVFIESINAGPVYITGNSSGGLLTTWLAANLPDLVKAIVLEDPPLFSAEYPEIQRTIAYKAFQTSFQAMREDYHGDFLDYWIAHSTQFFRKYTGPLSQPLIQFVVKLYKAANRGQAVELAFVPVSVQEMIRGLHSYNPHFGAAFYNGQWNAGFDHAEALGRIQCPTLLLHTNFEIEPDGCLVGAMSQEQADKAASLLKNGTYLRVDSAHVIHLEHPDEFVDIVENFFSTQ